MHQQGWPAGANDFAHAYFLCPFGRTGGGQVHKIDAGDQQNESCDDAEKPDIFDAAPVYKTIFESRVQVFFRKGRHIQLDAVGRAFFFIPVNKISDLCFYFGRIGVFTQLYISGRVAVTPVVYPTIILHFKGLPAAQEIELHGRVRWKILEHGGYPEVLAVFIPEGLTHGC